ncbi:MAG: PaaI family thioesterase [Chloroflexi bacterium]|nr:PaaI family thioesterase [Chloroflexota bacterium]
MPSPTGHTAGDFDPRLYDQVCFACGGRNPHGLHLRFSRDTSVEDGGAVICRYDPRPEDQGFPGVMHGGILAALLDESMAWAMWAADRALGVTAKMETRYRKTVGTTGTLVVRGRVVRMRGRRIEVEASVEDASGERLAEATALFMRLAPEVEREMSRALGWADIPG